MPLREIPIEVWEKAIDQLEGDRNTLLECTKVCRGWTARSRLHLRKWLILKSPAQVPQLAKLVRAGLWEVESCRTVNMAF